MLLEFPQTAPKKQLNLPKVHSADFLKESEGLSHEQTHLNRPRQNRAMEGIFFFLLIRPAEGGVDGMQAAS